VSNIYITKPRRRYIFGWWGVIDLLAIVPSLINFIDLQQVRVARILRVLRFLRLMRILKLAKVVAEGVEGDQGKEVRHAEDGSPDLSDRDVLRPHHIEHLGVLR
jgi:hypothetical protein